MQREFTIERLFVTAYVSKGDVVREYVLYNLAPMQGRGSNVAPRPTALCLASLRQSYRGRPHTHPCCGEAGTESGVRPEPSASPHCLSGGGYGPDFRLTRQAPSVERVAIDPHHRWELWGPKRGRNGPRQPSSSIPEPRAQRRSDVSCE